MISGAVGDALGFPVEAGFVERIEGFIDWRLKKELVRAGEYSDDTQLTLATARSIWNGRFHPEYFAYVELPLWVYYERGGGRSTKKAAMNLFSPRIQWHGNFYIGYEEAGGSGGVMRIFPIVDKVGDFENAVEDIFKNVMITHGHPSAFVGAYVFLAAKMNGETIENLERVKNVVLKLSEIPEINKWSKERKGNIWKELESSFEKALRMIGMVEEVSSYKDYCGLVGEYDHPGEGLSVSLCAYYLFKRSSNVREAIFKAANEKGTDTDTIASIVGNLFDTTEGIEDLAGQVQDSEYIEKLRNFEKEREVNRKEITEWAKEYETALKEGKMPKNHPIFGELEFVEDRGKRRFFKTEEGQTVLL